MVELIVVIAIIAVLTGTILVGLDSTAAKINEANSTASDFYVVAQTEFTHLQMFDGPLTMSLNDAYKGAVADIDPDTNGGLKYYPAVGGNYPFDGTAAVGETHENGTPKSAELYIELYTFGGMVRRVNYANTIDDLRDMTGSGNKDAQLSLVLKGELSDRVKWKDGYYYAKIVYTAPTGMGLSKNDYRSNSVIVEWAAYSPKEMTDNEDTYYFKSANLLRNGAICGVHTTSKNPSLGTTGTVF